MDPVTLETTIKVHLKEIRERLDHAASIARAAQRAPTQAMSRRALRSRSMSNS
jgi:hypothetical protein